MRLNLDVLSGDGSEGTAGVVHFPADLKHFGLPAEFPKFRPAPAQSLYAEKRGPPDEDCQLDPRVDQYDTIDPPAPED